MEYIEQLEESPTHYALVNKINHLVERVNTLSKIQAPPTCSEPSPPLPSAADQPLTVQLKDDRLVISVGINRIDGHDRHADIPALKFDDRHKFVEDVIYELENEKEDGSTSLSDLLDTCIAEAIEQGSVGLAVDTPTEIGTCRACHSDCVPTRWFRDGTKCEECIKKITDIERSKVLRSDNER